MANRSLNEVDENSPSAKRSKRNDDDNTYLRGRIVELELDNKKLVEKIQIMETQWMRMCAFITHSHRSFLQQ